MAFVDEAFEELLDDKAGRYKLHIEYSGRFREFNAKVRMRDKDIYFLMSKSWKGIDTDIQSGLIQELICKLFKLKKTTKKMELYNIFVKNMHIIAEKKQPEPLLEESFHRINERYFFSLVERPNLRFGKDSHRTLGSYNFHNDTITISGLMKDAPTELLDYIMYHEVLHKKLKFDHKKKNRIHHTSEFRKKEKEYENFDEIEKKLDTYLKKKRRSFPK